MKRRFDRGRRAYTGNAFLFNTGLPPRVSGSRSVGCEAASTLPGDTD
jgi:hypothetical protein